MAAVILNHLYGPRIYGQLTYPFELVGFFFVAGYTFNARNCFLHFLIVKMKTLLLPLICLGLINALLSFGIKGGSLLWRVGGLFMQLPGEWDDMWFVACLFTMEMIFYVVLKFISNLFYCFICCIALGGCALLMIKHLPFALCWHIENAFLLLPFLFMGYATRTTNFGQHLIIRCRGEQGLYLLFLVVTVYVVMAFAIPNYPIDIHLHQYGNIIVFLLSALLGLCVVICLSLQLERIKNAHSLCFLSYVGANTLVYYAFQSKVISLLFFVCSGMAISLNNFVVSIACCISVCVILAIPAFLVRKYFPIMIGKF